MSFPGVSREAWGVSTFQLGRLSVGDDEVCLQEGGRASNRGVALVEQSRVRLEDVLDAGGHVELHVDVGGRGRGGQRVASSNRTSYDPTWIRSGAIPRRSANSGLNAPDAASAAPA